MPKLKPSLSIRQSSIRLYRGGQKSWAHSPDSLWCSVEQAALAYFQEQGWEGDSGEGKIILSLIKAASFFTLPAKLHSVCVEAIYSNNLGFIDVRELNIRLGRDPETPASPEIEAYNREQFLFRAAPCERVAIIETATEQRIAENFEIMTAPGTHTLGSFPTLTRGKLLSLYRCLGNSRLARIAEKFGADPYTLRSGWPDLTLWRGSDVAFKEIKAPEDYIRENQIHTIETVLLPLGLDVELVNVVPL